MNSIEQKNGRYLEEERPPVFCLNATRQRVSHANERMSFWLRVAEKEGINVLEEKVKFEKFYERFQKKVTLKPHDSVGILLLEGCICLTIDKVGKHVRENIRRVPDPNIIEELGKELQGVSQKWFSWKKIAEEEKIECNEEENVFFQNFIFEKSKEKNLNFENSGEISKRRLILICQFITCNLIRRVYSQRITQLSQIYINKFRGTEHEEVLLGIVKEAFEGLSSGSEIKEMEKRCQTILELYKANLELLAEDPEKYHLLADLEMIRRQVHVRIQRLIKKAKKDPLRLKRIQELNNAISYALNTENDIEELIKKINYAMNAFEKMFFENTLNLGCGFLNDK